MISYVLVVRVRTDIDTYVSDRVSVEWSRTLIEALVSLIKTKSVIFVVRLGFWRTASDTCLSIEIRICSLRAYWRAFSTKRFSEKQLCDRAYLNAPLCGRIGIKRWRTSIDTHLGQPMGVPSFWAVPYAISWCDVTIWLQRAFSHTNLSFILSVTTSSCILANSQTHSRSIIGICKWNDWTSQDAVSCGIITKCWKCCRAVRTF